MIASLQESPRLLATLQAPRPGTQLNDVAFAPRGRVITAGADGTVRLWDVARDRLVGGVLDSGTEVSSIALDPTGGRRLATAGGDGRVRLWDLDQHRASELPPARGGGELIDVAFAPDGATLAAASIDGSVQFWDVRRRTLLGAGRAPTPANRLSFSPDGETVATTSKEGGPVVLWDVAARRVRETISTGATAPRSPSRSALMGDPRLGSPGRRHPAVELEDGPAARRLPAWEQAGPRHRLRRARQDGRVRRARRRDPAVGREPSASDRPALGRARGSGPGAGVQRRRWHGRLGGGRRDGPAVGRLERCSAHYVRGAEPAGHQGGRAERRWPHAGVGRIRRHARVLGCPPRAAAQPHAAGGAPRRRRPGPRRQRSPGGGRGPGRSYAGLGRRRHPPARKGP